jgi:hypothetical protein
MSEEEKNEDEKRKRKKIRCDTKIATKIKSASK